MPIFPIFFLGYICQENGFYDILERKNAFLGYKHMKFKNSKNWHFLKGVNTWFWSKNGHFSDFYFLGNIGQEICLLRYSRTKKRFLGYKNKKINNLKNWHFSEGVNPWFWSKNGPFSNFYFLGNIDQEICLLRYSRTKKRLFLKEEIQKAKKLTFFKRG